MLKRHTLSYSGVSILILSICLIAVNVVGNFIPLRLDLTEESLYTISDGTRELVGNLEEPVTLKFYYSRGLEDLPPNFKIYAQRVQEILEEYQSISAGQVRLEVINPEPDTVEEEWAIRYGVAGIDLPNGIPFYMGLVAVMLDQEEVIPFFDIRREELLEYDISKLILKVSTTDLNKVGILTSLNMMGAPPMPGQPQQGPWAIISELEQRFTVETLDKNLTEIPDDISILLLVHPKDFNDRLQYAIDQYVLRGGRAVVLLDSNSREDLMNPGMAQRMPDPSSNLPKLLSAWGVEFSADKLVGDIDNPTTLNARNLGQIRYPFWMSLDSKAIDGSHPITSKLESLMFVEAGHFTQVEGAETKFQPLISTSTNSGVINAAMTRYSTPDKILRDLKPDHTQKHLTVLVQGKFKTAFPGGQPSKPQPAEGEENPMDDAPLKHDHLSQAKDSGLVLLFGDSDFMADSYSVSKINFLGQTIVQPTNDNLNLALNAVEYLTGNDALMSIRTRGKFQRPFTVLKKFETTATEQYREKEALLQQKLTEVRDKISDIQKAQGPSDQVELTPAIKREIEQFREQELTIRRQLREVRKTLRENVEALETQLLAVNALVVPLLVALGGLFFFSRRNNRRK